MNTFGDFGLSPEIMEALRHLGYQHPTPIQEKVIPSLLAGKKDLIGLAQTGTGKTAAFGIPIVQQIDLAQSHVQVIVLCPTRELCLQISEDLKAISKFIPSLRIVSIYGGSSVSTQIQELKRGAHIIVGTPGRVIDMLERKKLDISKIKTVVLDEADEMLNMGFREDLDVILTTTPSEKNTLMFSATMSKEIAAIASNFMKDPMEITIGRRNEGSINIRHLYYIVQSQHRYEALKRILDVNPGIYGIIFCRTRQETKDIADKLIKDGYNADALHGDLSQSQRDSVMAKFRNHHLQVLVATDVAARGIDVDDITHVIHYNLPDETEVYNHRSGRTGRAGKKGISISIIHSKEQYKIKQIEKLLNRQMERALIPNAREICEKQLFTYLNKYEALTEINEELEPYLPAILKKLQWIDKDELIRRIVTLEFKRLLDYYKGSEDLNVSVKNEKNKDSERKKTKMVRLFINVGTKDKINKTDLIGMINEATGSRNIDIGKIELMPKFSFFEADESQLTKLISAFQEAYLDERRLVLELAQERRPSSAGSNTKSKYHKTKGVSPAERNSKHKAGKKKKSWKNG